MGFAFAEENKDKVAEVAGRQGRQRHLRRARRPRPSPTAAYPLSRALYIYVNKAKAAANPAVVAFVDYYLADGTISTVLETVPYVNLPADELAAVPDRLGRREGASSPPGERLGQLGARPVRSILHPHRSLQESSDRWHRPARASAPASR